MTTRRDFIRKGGVAFGAFAALNRIPGLPPGFAHGAGTFSHQLRDIPTTDEVKALMADALNAAKSAGASYSDVRIGRYQNNFVITREKQIVQVVDTDSMGAGVRALVDGTWGFAATRVLTSDAVAAADLQRVRKDPLQRRNARVHLSVPAVRAGRRRRPEDRAGCLGRAAVSGLQAGRVSRADQTP